MIKPVLLLFIISVSTGFGQENRLLKLLGKDFQAASTRKNCVYMETNPECKIVPSTTLNKDTSGITLQNEFVLFRNYIDPAIDYSKAILTASKTSYVTNAEFQEFQNWVRDSMAREQIFAELRINQQEEGLTYLNLTKEEQKNKRLSSENNYEKNRYTHSLNWNKKFSYSDPDLIPILSEMYLDRYERFYKQRDFDERRLIYHYLQNIGEQANGATQMEMQTPTIVHQEYWGQRSVSINDEFSVLGQSYTKLLPENPVIGLTGMQANAFCFWKQIQLQELLNEQKLPYKVVVTLPLASELTTLPSGIIAPAKDYTSQWKITVADYSVFTQAVQDSSIMEILYHELTDDEQALELLQEQNYFFSEKHQAMVDVDPSDRNECRQEFPFTKNRNFLKKHRAHYNAIYARGNYDQFIYYQLNIASKAVIGQSQVKLTYAFGDTWIESLVLSETDDRGEPFGQDMRMDYLNILLQGNGVRSHENYARFIQQNIVTITPTIPLNQQTTENPVQGITYEQALAYYHWKYPIWKAKTGDNWQDFVYPTEEQFAKIQNGETILVPEHNLEFPSPVFRYVVTFIPVK